MSKQEHREKINDKNIRVRNTLAMVQSRKQEKERKREDNVYVVD